MNGYVLQKVLAVGTLVLLAGCTFFPGSRSDHKMRHVKLLVSDNPTLTADLEADTVSRTEVKFSVPLTTDVKALVLRFEVAPDVHVALAGKTVVSRETGIDFTSTRVFTLTADDGTSNEFAVAVDLPPLVLNSATALLTRNPGLSKDIIGQQIDDSLVFDFPPGADRKNLNLDLSSSARSYEWQGSPFDPTAQAVDLTLPQSLTLVGGDGKTLQFEVRATEGDPTAKDLTRLRLFFIDGLTAPFNPLYDRWGRLTEGKLIDGSDRDTSLTGITWEPYGSLSSKTSIYLEVDTNGASITAQGRTLTLGALPDKFSQDNWLDLTGPVVLTVKAYDGSTRDFTLTLN